MTRREIAKLAGVLICIALTVTLWITCLRLLLQGAAHDPGGYVIAGFVFLLLPFAAVVCIGAIQRERRGYWTVCRCSTQEEWRANHGLDGTHNRVHIPRHTPQYTAVAQAEYERLTADTAENPAA